jgi:hypothetical protein
VGAGQKKAGDADDLVRAQRDGTHAIRNPGGKSVAGARGREIAIENRLPFGQWEQNRVPVQVGKARKCAVDGNGAWPGDQFSIAGAENFTGLECTRRHDVTIDWRYRRWGQLSGGNPRAQAGREESEEKSDEDAPGVHE